MTTSTVLRPARPEVSRHSLRWFNGAVHWISAVVLVYAFVSNGETNRALFNDAAMRGEVRLGLVVALIFLVRFVWVQFARSGGGRWAPVRMPQSIVRRITDWGIYVGVAVSVVTGLLIAYLRPGVVVFPEGRGFFTASPALNAALVSHAFLSNALIWLCGFHALYALWFWIVRRTRWGSAVAVRLGQLASAQARRWTASL
jgi:cytochrome b561